MEFNYVIILVCIVFLGFLIYKEIKRNDKSRLLWRILANSVMVTSFALLIIPIIYSSKKQNVSNELNLLTEGASLDTLLALKGEVYDLDSTLFPRRRNLKINHVSDLNYHLKSHPEIKKINIYGYGLTHDQLKHLRDYQVSFRSSDIPSGVISASWPKKLKASEQLTIQGVYNNPTNKSIKLQLQGLGVSLDSINIKPNSKVDFSFTQTPKLIGKAIFNLITFQDKDTLAIEPIPFEIENQQPVKILILASFPDFEYKFLKKWLYENKYPVAFRSQISKNKYNTDFLNRKPVNLSQLNQTLLKSMDLAIIDEDELSSISSADRSSIYTAVNNGMGLIVRITQSKPKTEVQSFNRYEIVPLLEKPLIIQPSDHLKFVNLPTKQTLFLKPEKNHQPLLTDETGKIIVDRKLNGIGKILASTISSTYQWQLAGKQADYARFWSLLFAKSLRQNLESQSFELFPQFLSVDQKARVIVSLTDLKTPTILFNTARINPRQNMELPFVWDGFFWPKLEGWNTLSINKKLENSYIYKKTAWKNAKNFIKLKNTSNFVSSQPNHDFKRDKVEYTVNEEVSRWWFFGVFLIAIAFLWYEQRFLENK